MKLCVIYFNTSKPFSENAKGSISVLTDILDLFLKVAEIVRKESKLLFTILHPHFTSMLHYLIQCSSQTKDVSNPEPASANAEQKPTLP